MLLPLETFRGVFALVIVLHHLKINTPIHTSNFIQNGGLVVDFFFVLSGFIIAYNYLGKINSTEELILFQKKTILSTVSITLINLNIFYFY